MIRNAFSAALLATGVFLCISCSGGSSPAEQKSRVAPPDPSWVTTISQHSSGAISRFSPVRVFFTQDVIPEAKVGQDGDRKSVV